MGQTRFLIRIVLLASLMAPPPAFAWPTPGLLPPTTEPAGRQSFLPDTNRNVEASLQRIEFLESEIDRLLADARLKKAFQKFPSANEEATAAFAELNEKTDALIKEEFRAILEITKASTQEIVEFTLRSPDKAQTASFKRLLEKLETSRAAYLENENHFGQPKDFLRFNAFHDYMNSYLDLLDATAAWSSPPKSRLLSAFLAIRSALREAVQFAKVGWAIARPVLRLCYAVFFEAKTGPGRTPITTSALTIFEQWGKISGLLVDVRGQERVPIAGPDDFNIFVPNHVDAFLDAYVGSQLGIKNYITVGALNLKGTKIFSLAAEGSESLLKQVDKNDHFFLLGRGHDTLKKIVDAVKAKKSRNMFIFTQGMVSLGLQETNPVRDGLPRIIEAIQEAGFKVNVIPVSMPDNGRLLRVRSGLLMESDSGPRLRATFEEPLRDEALRRMSREGTLTTLNDALRAIWMRSLATDQQHILGMKRWRQTIIELRARGWLPRAEALECSRIFE